MPSSDVMLSVTIDAFSRAQSSVWKITRSSAFVVVRPKTWYTAAKTEKKTEKVIKTKTGMLRRNGDRKSPWCQSWGRKGDWGGKGEAEGLTQSRLQGDAKHRNIGHRDQYRHQQMKLRWAQARLYWSSSSSSSCSFIGGCQTQPTQSSGTI